MNAHVLTGVRTGWPVTVKRRRGCAGYKELPVSCPTIG